MSKIDPELKKWIETKKCRLCGKESENLCPVDKLCPSCHITVFGDT